MIQELSQELMKRDLRWKKDSFKIMFMDTMLSHVRIFAYDKDGEHAFEEVNVFDALGVILCKDYPQARASYTRLFGELGHIYG